MRFFYCLLGSLGEVQCFLLLRKNATSVKNILQISNVAVVIRTKAIKSEEFPALNFSNSLSYLYYSTTQYAIIFILILASFIIQTNEIFPEIKTEDRCGSPQACTIPGLGSRGFPVPQATNFSLCELEKLTFSYKLNTLTPKAFCQKHIFGHFQPGYGRISSNRLQKALAT